MSELFRLGLVGCGWIAGRHALAASSLSDVAFVACADVRSDAAESWAAANGCERSYDDYEAMVREHELDGVVLATWPNLHRDQVLTCIDAGVRHILCEKSLALTGAEALEIQQAAQDAGVLVTEAYMYRHHPATRKLDELAGSIGALDAVSATFDLFDPQTADPDDDARDWRQHADRAGGVPWDLTCYCVDACNRFARARPLRASAFVGRSERYGTVDRLHGLIEYENGVIGHLRSSKRGDADYELTLAGATGRLSLPVAWIRDGPAEVVITRSCGWAEFETERHSVEPADSFTRQLERFVAAARGERGPEPTLAESVVTALTLDALLLSGAEHAMVEVELPAGVSA